MSDGIVSGMVNTGIDTSVQSHIDAANLAERQGNHGARAEHATAALKAMSAAYHPTPTATPSNPIEAAQRLDFLNKSADFRSRYAAGNVDARREFDALNKLIADADPVALAVAGVAPVDGIDQNAGAVAGGREMVAAADHLRAIGFTDGNVKEWYTGQLEDNTGRQLSPAETAVRVAEAERWIASARRDPVWVKAFLSGDPRAVYDMTLRSGVIAAGRK